MLRRRIFTVMLAIGVSAVLAGCGQFGSVEKGGDDEGPTTSDARIADEGSFDAAAAKKYGCGKVESPDDQGQEHVEEGEDVKYDENPPTSGSHDPTPLEWGVYDTEQRDEDLLHNMEHGHLWIAHKGLKGDEEDALLKDVAKVRFHLVVTPRKANEKNGIWYVAWNHKMFCEKYGPEPLQYMIDEYRDQAPEVFMDDPSKPLEE